MVPDVCLNVLYLLSSLLYGFADSFLSRLLSVSNTSQPNPDRLFLSRRSDLASEYRDQKANMKLARGELRRGPTTPVYVGQRLLAAANASTSWLASGNAAATAPAEALIIEADPTPHAIPTAHDGTTLAMLLGPRRCPCRLLQRECRRCRFPGSRGLLRSPGRTPGR